MKRQLTGEAKFMRAFLHFYAVNLYGDIPLITVTNYLANNQIARTPKKDVFKQIIKDLQDAKDLLGDDYSNGYGQVTGSRTRPNRVAAGALLARAYLFTGDWVNAEVEASLVISNTKYKLGTDLKQVFNSTSAEAIWQLAPVDPSWNTQDARFFVLTSVPGTG